MSPEEHKSCHTGFVTPKSCGGVVPVMHLNWDGVTSRYILPPA